jgi:hypothetical protein
MVLTRAHAWDGMFSELALIVCNLPSTLLKQTDQHIVHAVAMAILPKRAQLRCTVRLAL